VSSQVVRDLLANDATICWFSYGGWFAGMATGLSSKHVALRLAQYAAGTGERALALSKAVTAGKIRNSRVLLRRNARGNVADELALLQSAVGSVAQASTRETLLGIEGAAARTYFSAFRAMLSDGVLALPGSPFDFLGRNRRPPRDAVNCLLSYLYALLVKDLTVTCEAVGLDPYFGFYHRPRYGRPALALDLAEEFRPLLAESVTIQVVNNGELKPSDFIVRAGGVALTAHGRKKLIGAYERRLGNVVTHPQFGYKVSYRRALEVQARMLGAYLLGEIPAYTPFVTR
ncbi:MAG: CRISPR-associated endonuclease Cas1, partial [Acidimicrobiales bacterium]